MSVGDGEGMVVLIDCFQNHLLDELSGSHDLVYDLSHVSFWRQSEGEVFDDGGGVDKRDEARMAGADCE